MVIAIQTALSSASPAAERRPFDRMVVFGDSLSDTGNASGGRFSNGPVWVEHVARHLDLAVEPSSSGGTNHAYGGARAHDPGSPHNLRAQADGFLAEEPDRETMGRTLFVVFGGANDLLGGFSGQDPIVLAMNAVRVLGSIADDLASAGAGAILVPNLPDLAKVPAVRQYGPSLGLIATRTTLGFNQALEQTLAGVDSRQGGHVIRLDLHALVERVFDDPGVLGVADVNLSDPCVNGGRACANPDRHIFWDQVHPTAFGHARLGRAAIDLIEVSRLRSDP
ncbi:SGNH/GDSL hydrolase family protein [Skermanella stibiiresistens]|nr:SGNH/GDSL hydrolase family protein [Skermanella stibiiresistens]